MSLSDASTVPAAVWFSAALNVADEVNAGAAFASVEALPGSDQPLVPSSLVARTCTSYSVSSASPVIVARSAVLVVFVTSVHPGAVDFTWYR